MKKKIYKRERTFILESSCESEGGIAVEISVETGETSLVIGGFGRPHGEPGAVAAGGGATETSISLILRTPRRQFPEAAVIPLT